jgi:glycosyltransferase involved in cell wall biosynthesis
MLFLEKQLMKFLFWVFFKTHRRTHDKEKKPRLFWGPVPILSFKYWNEALREDGYESKTIMMEYYSINKKEDFDEYFYDIISPLYLRPFVYARKILPFLSRIHWVFYVAKNFDIIHITFHGLIYREKEFLNIELLFYKKLGIKIIGLPYGADFWQYSQISDESLKHVFLMSYPQAALFEEKIKDNIIFFTKHADIIIPSMQIDGLGKWDLFPYNVATFDIKKVNTTTKNYNDFNGRNGVVNIVHSPNHRYLKGTEYIIKAIQELKNEGYKIELILLEKVGNDQVLKILNETADILVEQLVLGYALSAMEGMACGLPVISNLSSEHFTQAFRRYSYLSECPILSANIEDVKEKLVILIKNPALRKTLGMAGRKYVEKYHSQKTVKYTFGKIYDKIWFNKNVDLMSMFHPLNENSYNNASEIVEHPLITSQIPSELFKTLNH